MRKTYENSFLIPITFGITGHRDVMPQDLERAKHLPLFYSAHWSRHKRASLAWAWEQLALGRVRWITDPDGFGDVLEPINKVGALPKAPELPTVVAQ